MSTLLLPFAYPGYPQDIVKRHIDDSRKYLNSLGIQFKSASDIVTLRDCNAAIRTSSSGKWDAVIILLSTWVEAPHVLRVISAAGLEKIPMFLWAHDNIPDEKSGSTISFGSIAAAGVLRETFEEMKYHFTFAIGNPDNDNLSRTILSFIHATYTAGRLRSARLGMVGYVSMGMYTGIADTIKVKKIFGSEIVHLDQYSLISQLDKVSKTQVNRVSEEIGKEWSLSPSVSKDQISKTAKILLRLKQLVKEQELDAVTVKCQYEMSIEYGFTPCVALSLLGAEIPVSCEGDMYLLLSQFILNRLTERVTTYGDVLALKENSIICAACGFAPKCYLDSKKPSIDKHTALYSGLLITSAFKKQPVTLIRLANDENGFKMHIIQGIASGMKNFHEIDCPAYAGAEITLINKTVPQFEQEMMSQHYAIVAGDCFHEAVDFCHLMGIRIV